eukprot:3632806-Pleurochrysis_carterae.AAC.1
MLTDNEGDATVQDDCEIEAAPRPVPKPAQQCDEREAQQHALEAAARQQREREAAAQQQRLVEAVAHQQREPEAVVQQQLE